MKILKIFAITSVIMLLFLGIAAFFSYRSYHADKKAEDQIRKEELDMQVYGIKKEDVSDDEKYPLSLTGAKKNVETFSFENAQDIYNVKSSKAVKDQLEEKKKRNKYSLENCLWAYNPYGTHELSLYLYFEAAQEVTLRYTIHIEDEDIPDFTRTPKAKEDPANNKNVECMISGLVPGVENHIILKLYDTKGNEVRRYVYTFTPPKLKGNVQKQLTMIDGSSLTELTNGLYFFMGHDSDNKKMPDKIYLYDNSGIIRGAIPLINSRAVRMMYQNDNLFYNCSANQFAEVSPFGQVMKTYKLSGYTLANDYTSDGFGNIIAIASKNKGSSVEDQIVTLNLKSGKTKHLVSMENVLKKVRKKAKNSSDWIGLNSIIWAENDSVIVSSGQLSGIIKVSNISSVKPVISYIIGDKNLWKKQGRTKGLLSKYTQEADTQEGLKIEQEPFTSQYGQSNVALNTQKNNTSDQYYLTMFNNNYNKKKAKYSYYYEYYVDELTGTYDLAKSFKVPYSAYESSAVEYGGNIIVNSGTDCSVSEYDKDGVLISQLKYQVETYTYRVFKDNLKNFWFS